MGRDASIIIQEVKFTYNGTFVCQVKNPPDVHGPSGEIRLRVVTTGLPPRPNPNIAPVVGNRNAYTFLLLSCRVTFLSPASFSDLLLLALAIGGGITAVVLFLVVVVSCRRCKKRRQMPRERCEEAPRKERKDPTVW